MADIDIVAGDLEVLSASARAVSEDLDAIDIDSILSQVAMSMRNSLSASTAMQAASTVDSSLSSVAKELSRFSANVTASIQMFSSNEDAASSRFHAVGLDSSSTSGSGSSVAPVSTPVSAYLIRRLG
ncbi:hypothetical protein [Schaalia vaccimaxillae]|uniref:hypothetical protein n=1 Tax=Schaalia vaccimaxillae TaxID=183916 RepID=UPI0003B79F0C|nr:hypothetical protein [Schaalia vaccimaxillae]